MRKGWVVLLLVAGSAQADGIIQCRGADGQLTFSDHPCPGGQDGKDVTLSAPAATYDSREAQERVQRSQQEINRRHAMERAAEAERLRRAQANARTVVDPVACANAERMYNYYGRSNGVTSRLETLPSGGYRTHNVVNPQVQGRYQEYLRACGKAPGSR